MGSSSTFTPADEYLISDLETLKVLSDPLRMRVLEAMQDKPVTVKVMAQRLDTSPKKLYYHVNLLEQHGLVVVVDTQVVSGIIEKWYQVAACSFAVDRNLLTVIDDPRGPMNDLLTSIFDATREDILRAARQHLIKSSHEDPKRRTLYLTHSVLKLLSDERDEFSDRLQALIEEFTTSDQNDDLQRSNYGITIAFYPLAPPRGDTAEASDDEQTYE